MNRRVVPSLFLAALFVGAGCGGDATGDPPDRDVPREIVGDASDIPPADLAWPDQGGVVDDRGFVVRIPQARTVPTEGTGGQTGWSESRDLDWMCTFRHDGVDGVFYLQDRPLKDCGWILGGIIWQTVGAWMAVDGQVTAVDAQYDSGGNHRNDWIRVAFRGRVYKYYHSSMGIAWRKCQAMDCLQVLDPADEQGILEDGCTSERTIPIWCVEVAEDGTVPPLDDGFHKCPGDDS